MPLNEPGVTSPAHPSHRLHHHYKNPDDPSLRDESIDYYGSILIVTAVICLCLALVWGGTPDYPWDSGSIIALFVVAGVLLIGFVAVESLQAEYPIMPLRCFFVRNFSAAVLISFFTGMSMVRVACCTRVAACCWTRPAAGFTLSFSTIGRSNPVYDPPTVLCLCRSAVMCIYQFSSRCVPGDADCIISATN